MNTNDFIVIGRLGKVYGIKGWIRVVSFTDPCENILHFADLFIGKNGSWHPQKSVQFKNNHGNILIKLPEIDTPELAKTYTNLDIAIVRESLPKLPNGEYYWSELEGLTVTKKNGVILGKVTELLATGANDVLVVVGEKKILIPYLSWVILAVDLPHRTITVDWDDEEDIL